MSISMAGPPRIPDEGMEDYLARMFNHGAVLTNVFGWNIGDKEISSGGPPGATRRWAPTGSSCVARGLTKSRWRNPTVAGRQRCRTASGRSPA